MSKHMGVESPKRKCMQGGPLRVANGVTTPLIGVITPVTPFITPFISGSGPHVGGFISLEHFLVSMVP